MEFKLLHIISAVLVLVGTWSLAFALRVKEGIDPNFRKELYPSLAGKIVPSDVAKRLVLFWIGLGLITLGGLLELVTIVLA